MSRRSLRGNVEGVAGEDCETGLNPLSREDGGGAPPENFSKCGCFLLQSRHSTVLVQGQDFSPNLKKNVKFYKLMNRLLITLM